MEGNAGLAGSHRRGLHKSPFVSPPAPGHLAGRNYLFSRRLGGLAPFHVAGVVGPLCPSRQASWRRQPRSQQLAVQLWADEGRTVALQNEPLLPQVTDEETEADRQLPAPPAPCGSPGPWAEVGPCLPWEGVMWKEGARTTQAASGEEPLGGIAEPVCTLPAHLAHAQPAPSRNSQFQSHRVQDRLGAGASHRPLQLGSGSGKRVKGVPGLALPVGPGR